MFKSIKHAKKRAFLAAFAECAVLSEACELAGISRETVYEWKRTDAEFRAACDLAYEMGGDVLEDVATQRAKGHWVELKDEEGNVTDRKYVEPSNRVLAICLAARKPEKYGKKTVEHTGKDGEPIAVRVTFVKPNHSDAA